jgi:hypothetical protein
MFSKLKSYWEKEKKPDRFIDEALDINTQPPSLHELKNDLIKAGIYESIRQELKNEIEPELRLQLQQEIRAELLPIIENQLVEGHQRSESDKEASQGITTEVQAYVLEEGNKGLSDQCPSLSREQIIQTCEELAILKQSRRKGELLDYFKTEEIKECRARAVHDLKEEMREEVRGFLEIQIRQELEKSLHPMIKKEIYDDLIESSTLRNLAISQLKRQYSADLKNEVSQGLRITLREKVERQLAIDLRPEIEASIRAELTPSIVEAIASDSDGSLAAILKQAKIFIQKEVETELEERSKKLAWQFLENCLHKAEIHSDEADKLRSEFLDLRDDISFAEPIKKNEGFCRALTPLVCKRSGQTIEEGDFFVWICGEAHSLPSDLGEAQYLAKLEYFSKIGVTLKKQNNVEKKGNIDPKNHSFGNFSSKATGNDEILNDDELSI